MAELKTKKNDSSVEEFLNSIPDESKRKDSLEIDRIMQKVTGHKPKMWGSSIVGYGTCFYKTADGKEHEWMALGFSPRKQKLTLYFMSGFSEYAEFNNYDPKPILEKLGKYSTSKSCLYIKRLSDINMNVLEDLILESYNAVTSNKSN